MFGKERSGRCLPAQVAQKVVAEDPHVGMVEKGGEKEFAIGCWCGRGKTIKGVNLFELGF